jgi:hypothetical protein
VATPRREGASTMGCLALNASYEPLTILPVERALRQVFDRKAEVLEADDARVFRSSFNDAFVATVAARLAQARQAATGDWRAFYEFRLVRRLIRRRRLSCLGLALLYALAAVPVTVFRILPAVQEQAELAVFRDRETPAEMIQALNEYTFTASLVLLPLFVGLHLAAARFYAGAVLGAVRDGDPTVGRIANPSYGGDGDYSNEPASWQLRPVERSALARLDLLTPVVRPRRNVVMRGAGRLTGWTWGLAVGALTAVVWFAFVAQIFVAEFFNYHPVLGWLNQPLVHLPWLHYVPLHLP